jgi:hypothetical protein
MTNQKRVDYVRKIAAANARDTHEPELEPMVETTSWGYVIHDNDSDGCVGKMTAIAGRFFGGLLLAAAAGLWIMPDSLLGPDVFAMKLGAMVMFTIFGGWLVWVGRNCTRLEYQVNLQRGEVTVGARDIRGNFRLKGVLAFADVASVYLLRSKDHSQPTRLFLRIGRGDEALEIASGDETLLEALRDRLTHDFAAAASPRPQPVRPRRVKPTLAAVA